MPIQHCVVRRMGGPETFLSDPMPVVTGSLTFPGLQGILGTI